MADQDDHSESVNNAAPADAGTNEGASSPLDQLYHTLGFAQAGVESIQAQLEHQRSVLLRKEQDLLSQRQAAQQASDQGTYDSLTAEWDDLRRALQVIDHHLTDQDGHELPTDQQPDRDGQQDERGSDSDPHSTGRAES